MIFVSICIGSSCHLKGSEQLVELFQNKIKEQGLENDIVLSGSFCLGKCNRVGVTVSVGDGINEEVIPGVTPESFNSFWNETVLQKLSESEAVQNG